jgi:hypothetical protein
MRRVLSLIGSGGRQGSEPDRRPIPDSNRRPIPDSNQRRLYLLGAAFLARGMKPEDAYNKALYYTKGSGRRQNWISALSEQDTDSRVSTESTNDSSDTPATGR